MIIPMLKKISRKRLRQLERDSGSQKYRAWRKKVMTRDGHKCQYPNCPNMDDLEVHHIKRFVDARYLRYEPFNGITLCEKHHLMVTGRESAYQLFFYKITMANTKRFAKQQEQQEQKAPEVDGQAT